MHSATLMDRIRLWSAWRVHCMDIAHALCVHGIRCDCDCYPFIERADALLDHLYWKSVVCKRHAPLSSAFPTLH